MGFYEGPQRGIQSINRVWRKFTILVINGREKGIGVSRADVIVCFEMVENVKGMDGGVKNHLFDQFKVSFFFIGCH